MPTLDTAMERLLPTAGIPSPLGDSIPHRTALIDHGAEPLLGYALACSVAWHTRRPTLLVAAAPSHPRELETLRDRLETITPGKSRAYLHLVGNVANRIELDRILAAVPGEFGQVLVQTPARAETPLAEPAIYLSGPSDPPRHGTSYIIRSPLNSSLLRPNRL